MAGARPMPQSKILIVEDDPGISRALGIRLRASGYEVVSAEDGVGGVAAVERHDPDLILLDISMPAGGGFFVAEHVMKRPETKRAPIIFVTATKAPGVRERAEEFFPAAYVEKPFESQDLLATISNVLGSRPAPRGDMAPVV